MKTLMTALASVGFLVAPVSVNSLDRQREHSVIVAPP